METERTQYRTSRPCCWNCNKLFNMCRVSESMDDKGDALMTCECGEQTLIEREFPPLTCYKILK